MSELTQESEFGVSVISSIFTMFPESVQRVGMVLVKLVLSFVCRVIAHLGL